MTGKNLGGIDSLLLFSCISVICYFFSPLKPEVHSPEVFLCNGMLVIIEKHGNLLCCPIGSELVRSVVIITPSLIGCCLAKHLFSI